MKAITELSSQDNHPRLIPIFKQNERRLLSIFMSMLELVPELRGKFFERCGYGSGKTCQYTSFMEPEYKSSNLPDVRPDGLVHCKRGAMVWTAFIEAKSDKGAIRTEQMQDYTNLASMLDVDTVISISNEFAKEPVELPYHLPVPKRKKRHVVHFAWAELRTFISLFLDETRTCSDIERALISQCLQFFWEKESGILTYDAMPQDWSKFVESAGTALGFSTRTQGVTEIVHGWQQERRDLNAKILFETQQSIEIRHGAGPRADQEQRLKYDRKDLAENYKLTTAYMFKSSKARLRILADLRSCKISAALEILPPGNKKAKACVTWISKSLEHSNLGDAKISFDWKGRGPDVTLTVSDLNNHIDHVCEGQKDAPKKIRLIREVQNVRRFKSRTKFIEDLESLSLGIIRDSIECGLV